MKDVLVIVPVYNESKNVREVDRDLRENFPEADVLYINDHSTDNTLEIISSFPERSYLNLPVNLGYFFTIQSGLKYANKKGYRYVVQFDGDGQHLASEAKRLYQHATNNEADVIIGSRYLEERGYKNSFLRSLGTGIIRGLFRLFTGKEMSDPTSGLQVLNQRAVSHLSKIYNYPETADANLLMELLFNGFKIEEVPVTMRARTDGESMHDGLIGPAKYMGKMLYYMSLVYFNHYTGAHDA